MMSAKAWEEGGSVLEEVAVGMGGGESSELRMQNVEFLAKCCCE